jgi:hypothetical protein
MTEEAIVDVICDRFSRWAKRLQSSHATPLFLLGIGHDHVSGRPVVCIPEGLPSERDLFRLLRKVIDELEEQATS